ncbi:MAG TPA: hypothetical protein PLJ32_06520 [Kiritimatiellia bacterium]|jgi:hypothetical protein|nr:hypothetical protein [Kiritimatiellia bacterium]
MSMQVRFALSLLPVFVCVSNTFSAPAFEGAFSGIAPDGSRGIYHGASVGMATLRRDGFASMDGNGTLTTRPVVFTGKHLFVNASGSLSVELLDAASSQVLLPPLTADSVDSTRHRLGNVSAFAGRPVRFRFRLTNASLYAFWVSPSESGASGGYLAAGGPGYTGHIDTQGALP